MGCGGKTQLKWILRHDPFPLGLDSKLGVGLNIKIH